MADAENIPDIDHGLASLTEETTAAEFLRSKGQHRKVKTINKEKLKQWITQAIGQTRAGMANAYNDEEKEELLKKTQEQLEEVMARAAAAEADVQEREKNKRAMASEIEALQARAADAEGVEDKSAELAAAMATIAKLQDQYNTSHQEAEDLRLDVFELQDQLNTKMALSRSTMEEKDRLKETMQGLMMRASDLTGGVMHLDQEYYAGSHAEENPVDDDIDLNEQFFHDFEVGSKVIESLSGDLQKLREITESENDKDPEAEAVEAASAGLLSRDLGLLEQLKAGSLAASDVAMPVDGLIEALDGAREEANTLEKEAAEAMGMPQTAGSVSALPDAGGDPAEVLAGATAVARELAALFAKQKNRLSALQMMVDEADSARSSEEAEVEQAQAGQAEAYKFYNALLENIKTQADEMGVQVGDAITDESAENPSRNAAAAQAVLELAQQAGDTAALEQYDALLGDIAEQAEASGVDADAKLTDADADVAERKAVAEQALAAIAQKATDDSVQNNYDALLERIAEEAKESEVDVPADMTDNDKNIEERQAAAEKALEELTDQSKNITALQEQLDEALQDVDIEAAPEPVAQRDHAAVKGLFADRIGTLVGKHKDLQQEHATLAEEKAQLEQEKAELERQIAETDEKLSAQAPHEKELAQAVMKAAQGDEELAGDDAVLDLALAIDDYNDDIATDNDERNLVEQSSKVIQALGERKHALMTELAQLKASQLDRDSKMENIESQMAEALAERDEMAESGKEIISQLTSQRDGKVKELEDAKSELNEKDVKLNELEASIHGFADRLNDLVADEDGQSDAVASAKADARAALDKMPGEKSVPLKQEVASELTTSGIALIDALSRDGGAKAKTLETELAAATAAVAAGAATAAAKEAEIAAKEKELDEAKEQVAAKENELNEAKTAAEAKDQDIKEKEEKIAVLEEAEQANREVAKHIAALAGVAGEKTENEEIEDLHADLEVTLSEVPEDEAALGREGLNKELADNGVAVLDAIKKQLEEKGAALDKTAAERDELKGLLRDSRAAIEEYRARNEESSNSSAGEVKDLSAKLSEAEKAKDKVAREMQQQIDDYRLEENVLKKKIDELTKQVQARDDEILSIKRAEDNADDQQVELSTLQAQSEALEEELKEARRKLQAYEEAQSAVGGKEEFSAGALKSEVAKLREEREELRNRIRGVEDELATEKSRVESMKEDRQNLRDEFDKEREQIESNLEREKTAHAEDSEALKKLRSDLAGAQARIRALSESGDAADDGGDEPKII